MKRYLPIVLSMGLAACGSSAPSQPAASAGGRARSQSSPTSTAAATPVTTSTATTATSSTPTSATTAPSGGAALGVPCQAANLSLSFAGEGDAAGHGLLRFALKNVGSVPCHTYGFPGVQFLDSSGGALTTVPHHLTNDYFGPAPEREVTLNPGQSGSFRIGVTHGAIPGSVCTTARGLQVIPPDDTASIRTTISPGAYECQDANVSPIEPGTKAYS